MGQSLACYICNLVVDDLGTCSLCEPVSTVNGKISHHDSYELPYLAVDSADHSPKRQQEGHLHMSRLSLFGGFAIDFLGVGAS